MDIHLKYNNKNDLLTVRKFQSIESIIYKLKENYNNFSLKYQDRVLDKNSCLDKYEIKENSCLELIDNNNYKSYFDLYKNKFLFIIYVFICLLYFFLRKINFGTDKSLEDSKNINIDLIFIFIICMFIIFITKNIQN